MTGFNVGINAGKSAGQTIFHVHVHLIPRRDGDVDQPKGGVRGTFPKPVKIGDRAVAWLKSDIDAWQSDCIAKAQAK